MKKVLLVDFQKDLKQPIRKSVTGTFGSKTQVNGIMGKLYKRKKNSGALVPPLYFAYAASIFAQNNWIVEHSYCLPDNSQKYDLILFASSMPGSNDEILALSGFNRQNTILIVLGAFAKEKPELYLDHCDGVVIDGEPEDFLIDYARGLITLPKNKLCRKANTYNVDDYPFPSWGVFSFKQFSYDPILKGPGVPLITTRGCPYNCDYCHYMPEAGPVSRSRSIENILDEIIYVRKLGINNIVFRDLVFTINRKKTIDLCHEIKRANLDISWVIETRLDKLDPALIDEMVSAGLKHINLGVESPSEEILKSVGRKPFALVQQEKIIQYLHKVGVTISAFYIIGFMDDTHASVRATISYAKQLNTLAAQFCVMTPFPGTKLYDDLKDKIVDDNWSHFTEYHPTLKLNHLSSDDVIYYRDKAYKDYYLRPKWIFKHWRRLL